MFIMLTENLSREYDLCFQKSYNYDDIIFKVEDYKNIRNRNGNIRLGFKFKILSIPERYLDHPFKLIGVSAGGAKQRGASSNSTCVGSFSFLFD